MDFHLQNVRTGETVKLSPDRTLIGTAEHATVRTAEGGPYLAALVVRYVNTWTVFGLSDDSGVTFNRRPLRAGTRVAPKRGDLLVVGDERFTFLAPGSDTEEPTTDLAPPVCFAYICNPDGMEECRTVDHDLLFGRLSVCHVQLADSRLSRLSALFAAHNGKWYVHALAKKPLGLNRKPIGSYAPLADGDELLIGPLVVRVEIRPPSREVPALSAKFTAADSGARRPALPAAQAPGATDFSDATEDGSGEQETGTDLSELRAAAQRLELWLKGQSPTAPAARGGLGGWFGAQRDRLRRFWLDTPETTSARSLRAAGRPEEAFSVLDRAIRTRPDGPDLFRELYRLYDAIGFIDLCYRPLRQIEKLAEARGTTDTWVLETLARLCERLGRERSSMIDRAIGYWNKLEAATGVSYARQRTDALAVRALRDGGYAGASGDGI